MQPLAVMSAFDAPQSRSHCAIRATMSVPHVPPFAVDAAMLSFADASCRTSWAYAGFLSHVLFASLPGDTQSASVTELQTPASVTVSGFPHTVIGRKRSVMAGWLPQKPGVRVMQPFFSPQPQLGPQSESVTHFEPALVISSTAPGPSVGTSPPIVSWMSTHSPASRLPESTTHWATFSGFALGTGWQGTSWQSPPVHCALLVHAVPGLLP